MISRLGYSLVAAAWFCGCTAAAVPPPPPVRLAVAIPDERRLDAFAVSPDGQWLAYSAETADDGRRRLFLRSLQDVSGRDREVTSTLGATSPFFSPDSTSVAYFAQGGLWRIPVADAAEPQRIADAPVDAAGGTWTEDSRIVFAPLGGEGLMNVPAMGGATTPVTELDGQAGEVEHSWPHVVPGGAVVFTVSQRGRDPHLEVLSPGGARRALRVPLLGQSQYVETGHLVYGFLGNLMAVSFDVAAGEIRGVPAVVVRGLQVAGGDGVLGRSGFAVSRSGTLAWLPASAEDARSRLVRVARDGRYVALPAPAEVYQTPRLSPDGRRLAVVVRPGIMTREIRVLDAARPDRVLFAVRGGDNQSPAWMDNRRLTFGSNRDGPQKIYVATSADASTPLFTADVAAARNPAGWIRSPRLLVFYEIDPLRRRDVLIYRVGEFIAPVAATPANERSPTLSPDGKWVAYVSDASGRDEIYVRALEPSAVAVPLTSGGAAEPVWTREGLFYRAGERMVRVAFKAGIPGSPQTIFDGRFDRDPGSNLAAYDVDGRGGFIMLKAALVPSEIRVVRHWGTELTQALPR